MSTPTSAKALFRATKRKAPRGREIFDDLPHQVKPEKRDPLDYDPTPPNATRSFLDVEAEHIRKHGNTVTETAIGGGHISKVLREYRFRVLGMDIEDRNCGQIYCHGSFFDTAKAPSPIELTNPPYGLINAKNGHGRWFWHGQDMGFRYRALLLNADLSAARINGMDRLFTEHPPSIEYICCWKIDFRGGGAPPQRNSWLVWDTNRPALGPNTWIRKRLYKSDPNRNPDQSSMMEAFGE